MRHALGIRRVLDDAEFGAVLGWRQPLRLAQRRIVIAGIAGRRRVGLPEFGDSGRPWPTIEYGRRRTVRHKDRAALGVVAGDDTAKRTWHGVALDKPRTAFVRLTRRSHNVLGDVLLWFRSGCP